MSGARYRLSHPARKDLLEIWRFVAEDSTAAADRLVENLTKRFPWLTENPYLGSAREKLGHAVRLLPVGSYVILYRVTAEFREPRQEAPAPDDDPAVVEIIRVSHASRDLLSLMSE